MINTIKRKNDFANKDLSAQFYNARAANAARTAPRRETNNQAEDFLSEINRVQELLRNNLLNRLSSESFAKLFPHLEPIALGAGEILHKPGETVRFVYFPETAVVSQLHILASGSTVETAMIGRDGVVGLPAVWSAAQPTCWSEVAVAGGALKIKAEIVRDEFKRCAALQMRLLDYASRQLEHIAQKSVCNIHHLAEERLCSWLLMLQDRTESDLLPLTHDQIARYLGVHRPSVTHIAMSLRKRDLINYVRGYVKIVDRARLESLACECYALGKEHALAAACVQLPQVQ